MNREEAKKRLEIWLKCGECPEDKRCYDSYLHSTCEYTDYCDDVSIGESIKVAIEALEQVGCLTDRPCEYCKNHVDGRCAAWDCAFDDVLSSSENPNKSEIMTGWIPVSERLPEKYTYTLWCASSGYVRSDYFNGEFWEDAKKLGYEVIAWMPLPEPYKAEGSEA